MGSQPTKVERYEVPLEISPSRRDTIFVLVWSAALAALVHVDWHVGRPTDMPPSLGWSMHWLLGIVTGIAMGWSFLRRTESGGVDLVIALGLGLVLGQLVEPALEVVILQESFAAVNPAIRWELFATFTLALMGGVAAAAAYTRQGRRAHDAQRRTPARALRSASRIQPLGCRVSCGPGPYGVTSFASAHSCRESVSPLRGICPTVDSSVAGTFRLRDREVKEAGSAEDQRILWNRHLLCTGVTTARHTSTRYTAGRRPLYRSRTSAS